MPLTLALMVWVAAARLLKPGGYFIMERFEDQAPACEELMKSQFDPVVHMEDLAGRSRFTAGTKL